MKNYVNNALGLIGCIALLGLSSQVIADNEKKSSTNPVGGGSGWNAEVKKAEPTAKTADGFALTEDAQKVVQSVSDYFNALTDLKGEFAQTNPDNKRAEGRFYLKRPGKLRFDYAPPSAMRIVADGKWLSVEDHDLKSSEQYPLESTPFRLLMKEKVDLLKDARLVDVTVGESIVVMTVTDKEDDGTGQLKLFFAYPEIALQQWIITDPQGLETKIELTNHVLNEKQHEKFFETAKFGLSIVED
ncbi:MAG: LolA family protein [Methyloligellaceae bacterium]